jgi:hypothetical protein
LSTHDQALCCAVARNGLLSLRSLLGAQFVRARGLAMVHGR